MAVYQTKQKYSPESLRARYWQHYFSSFMISDIDENIKKSIVRSFVDDTRVNRKISSPTDKNELQEHLNMMYKWARENKMEFNENKFEHMTFGKLEYIPYRSLQNTFRR